MMDGYIILAILFLLIVYIIILYNNIITKRNETSNAFGSIDAMLKKRYDLIPNLVETVKQYMIHEAGVLTEVTNLRSKLADANNSESKIGLHNDISKRLNNIMVSVENYPDLKASQNFLKLQASWNETEEQISAARRYYNTAVTDYNNSIETFPSSILTNIFKFQPMHVFEIQEIERQNISAKELFKK
jgi:LemA protein